MSVAIKVSGLGVRYGAKFAVRELDLCVERGEVFGFLGPNGAGKTTTIRALLDLLRPDEGQIEILGEPVRESGGALRGRIGFLPGDLALFPTQKGEDALNFFAGLYGRGAARRDHVLDVLGFPREALKRKVRSYSTGMRQMIGLTIAMQHEPELLILDEPTTGLDPLVREAFLDLIDGLCAEGVTVLFSSHILDEVERSAHKLALVRDGRIHLNESVDSLRRRLPKRVIVRYADGRRQSELFDGEVKTLIHRLEAERETIVDFEVRPVELAELFRHVVRDEEMRAR